MNPQYSDAYLHDFYSNYTSDEWTEGRLESVSYLYSFYLSLVERYAAAGKGKMLDIGCGDGLLLQAGLDRGWQAEGYDVDKETVGRVEKRIGVPIQCGDFTGLDWQDDRYDLVTMHQVLEHLKEPLAYLKIIRNILKQGGVLFIASPDINSLSNRIKQKFERMGIKKKRVGSYYDSDHHIVYLSPEVLKPVLTSLGFKVVYTRNGHSVKAGQSRLKRFIRRNISEYLWRKSCFVMIAQKQ
jgi:SAM-dependent methyltransferase